MINRSIERLNVWLWLVICRLNSMFGRYENNYVETSEANGALKNPVALVHK